MPFFVDKDYDDELLDEEFDMDSFNEACVYMELAQLPEEQRKAVVESEEAAILESKGKISRKTIVRLNRADDMASFFWRVCLSCRTRIESIRL